MFGGGISPTQFLLMANEFIIPTTTDFITDTACQFYYGYYTMSTDMGTLIVKLAIIFLVLEFSHKLFQFLFEVVKKKYFQKI